MVLSLLPSIFLNRWRIESLSDTFEHLHMIRSLFRVPTTTPGCVVECGTYKGASAANMSLACERLGRTLYVFDSFCGLPEPTSIDQDHHSVGTPSGGHYEAGQFAGSLEEVRNNIERFGSLKSCVFRKGFFADTLPLFSEPVVLAFMDVDLRSSAEDCVRALWPLLQEGCRMYTHEAKDLSIASLFFDKEWWHTNLNTEPPGLVGAGNGLGLRPALEGFHSDLGFAVK